MKFSLAKRIGFSGLALVLSLLTAEAAFRVAGFQGEVDRTVSWCREHALNRPPFFVPTEIAGTHAYVPLIEGQPRPFPVEKSPNTKRIFAFGGSAVHGYGFTRAGAWPDKLEEQLASAWPGQRIEVVNAGAIAWSSQQLLSLVKDVLDNYEPDALVVVSGNNELLEWFDARKYLPPEALSGWVNSIKRARLLRKSRLYQWLNARIDEDAGRWGQTEFSDDEALPWKERARMSDADRDFAVQSYRWNLSRILTEAAKADVPVVLGTVPVNWLESPASFEFADAPQDAHREVLQQILTDLREGRTAEADRKLASLLDDVPEALFAYEAGRLARELGQSERAKKWLAEAIRLDENPHRALPEINRTVRELASRADAFLDIESLLMATSDDGILDTHQVYDYCHLRPSSHSHVAEALAQLFVEEIWPSSEPLEPAQAGDHPLDSWLGEGVRGDEGGYSPNPGRDRFEWWKSAQEKTRETPKSAQAWLEVARAVWHTFHGICGENRGPCLPEAWVSLEVARRVDPENCAVQAAQARLAYSLRLEGTGALLNTANACNPDDERTAWYRRRWLTEEAPANLTGPDLKE
ncbi:MAG: hypothetical protein VXW32_08035 [Myxococcota bacterium]|nr:hypothetical protein [Myxococcota bacterium]